VEVQLEEEGFRNHWGIYISLVFESTLTDESQVAVKSVRIHGSDLDKERKSKASPSGWPSCWCTQCEIQRLSKAIEGWLELDHDNVMPIFGMALGFGPLPALVCPWMENGTLTHYLEQNYHQITASARKALVSSHHNYHNCCPISRDDIAFGNHFRSSLSYALNFLLLLPPI
jgi:hypothetical protein